MVLNQEFIDQVDEFLAGFPEVDLTTHSSLDVKYGCDLLLEEIADEELYKTRQTIVGDDIAIFFDNPKLPTAAEKMNMLERLGTSQWYNRWILERADDYALSIGDGELVSFLEKKLTSEPGKVALDNMDIAFAKVKTTVISKRDALDSLADIFNQPSSLTAEKASGYAQQAGIEMTDFSNLERTTVDLIGNLDDLDVAMPFFSIDGTNPMSQATMDMLESGTTGAAGATGFDLIPSIESILDAGLEAGIELGLLGLMIVGVEQAVPLVKSWFNPENWDPAGESQETYAAQMKVQEFLYGPYYKLDAAIVKQLTDNPVYVWYLDEPNARLGKNFGNNDHAQQTPCTSLWIRGRVVGLYGTKAGYDDADNLLAMIIKVTLGKTDPSAFGGACFWVNAEHAKILKDSARVQFACNTLNFKKIAFHALKEYPITPLTQPPPAKWEWQPLDLPTPDLDPPPLQTRELPGPGWYWVPPIGDKWAGGVYVGPGGVKFGDLGDGDPFSVSMSGKMAGVTMRDYVERQEMPTDPPLVQTVALPAPGWRWIAPTMTGDMWQGGVYESPDGVRFGDSGDGVPISVITTGALSNVSMRAYVLSLKEPKVETKKPKVPTKKPKVETKKPKVETKKPKVETKKRSRSLDPITRALNQAKEFDKDLKEKIHYQKPKIGKAWGRRRLPTFRYWPGYKTGEDLRKMQETGTAKITAKFKQDVLMSRMIEEGGADIKPSKVPIDDRPFLQIHRDKTEAPREDTTPRANVDSIWNQLRRSLVEGDEKDQGSDAGTSDDSVSEYERESTSTGEADPFVAATDFAEPDKADLPETYPTDYVVLIVGGLALTFFLLQ